MKTQKEIEKILEKYDDQLSLCKKFAENKKGLEYVLNQATKLKNNNGSWALNVITPILEENKNNEKVIKIALNALINGSKNKISSTIDWVRHVVPILLLDYFPHRKDVITAILKAALNGSKTEASLEWLEFAVMPIFIKFSNNKQIFDVFTKVLINTSKINSDIAFWIKDNLPKHKWENKQIFNTILQVMLNGSKLKNNNSFIWYIGEHLLEFYPNNKQVLDTLFKAAINCKEYQQYYFDNTWEVNIVRPLLKNPNVLQENKEILKKLFNIKEKPL